MTDNVVPIGDGRKKPTAPTTSGSLYPPPDAPLDVARKFYAETYDNGGMRTLVHYRGDWWVWTGQHWAELDYSALRSVVYERLGAAHYLKETRKNGVVINEEETAWNPTRNKIANVMEALSAIAHLDTGTTTPAFIATHDDIGAPSQVIACKNGLVSLGTRQLHPHTPAFFNVVSVTFAYDAQTPKPTAWLAFLNSVWPDDPDSVKLLQEWFGYVLCGRTDLQKILLLIGPSRSGKGTIARLVRKLIGHLNVAGPTLASLGTNFGLWPLVGKPLAIIADARLGGVPQAVIVERLLSISGEDLLTIDRKNRAHWIGTLPTRIMILSNELPHFTDSSGAIANRFMALRMRRSFLGAEDVDLDARLAAELPGILNWALDGLDRLVSKQRFTVPKASIEATTMLRELASPVATFVRDCCTTTPGDTVERDTLYRAWVVWANAEGIAAGDKARFGRDLAATVPDLGTTQPRINGKQLRFYTRIALNPVSPVSVKEDAGQSASYDTGDPVSGSGQLDVGSGRDEGDAGTRVSAETTSDVQEQHSDTGNTGQLALQVQTEKLKPTITCREWFSNHIAELRAAGHQQVDQGAVCDAGEAAGYRRQSIIGEGCDRPDVTVIGRGKTSTWWIDPDTPAPAYQTAGEWLADYISKLDDGTLIDLEDVKAASVHSWPNLRYAADKIDAIEIHSSGRGKPMTWTVRHRTDADGEEST